nr:ribonuclease H-like domain-containing protein [Tanacetum cinerariifolium]
MGDANPIRTFGDYSKPSHEGYKNTIELPEGNNVVPLRSDTIRGPHDTQYSLENPEQAFIEYASLRIDKEGGLVSNFMASQDARLSKFKADFKQQQSKMTNKIDTLLKAITDRIARALPSDTVKNPKLNVNSTSSVLSARSYPTLDPWCLSYPSTSINAVRTRSKEASHSQTSQPQTRIRIRHYK